MKCPKCGRECERDMVDVGVGEMAASPWGCFDCLWVEGDPVTMPDQPTDAGKDRETATAQREDIEERMGMSGLSHQQIVEALAARVSGDYYGSHVYLLASSQKSVVEWLLLALAAARREGQAQERQLLKDALMYLGSARQMLADTDMPGTPWWDGLTKMIAAIRACGEEPSR